ncbi:4Fe-4S binding protein [Candidatus Bathyarchaeota archaeon]|nr:4Fe-4S binding protein [Candidatus Bathyarchaeota archaeon]
MSSTRVCRPLTSFHGKAPSNRFIILSKLGTKASLPSYPPVIIVPRIRKERILINDMLFYPLLTMISRLEKDSIGMAARVKNYFKTHKITLARRVVQILVLLGITAPFWTYFFGSSAGVIEPMFRYLPFISAPQSEMSNSGGFLELILGSVVGRVFPFLLIGLLFMITLVFGRASCGWLCPAGLFQDITGWAGEVGNVRRDMGKNGHEFLRKVKNWILIILVIILLPALFALSDDFYTDYTQTVLGDFGKNPLGFWSLDQFLSVFIPDFLVATADGGLDEFFSGVRIAQLLFYFVIIILTFYFPRFYCRYFCPYAAVSKPISHYSILTLSRNPAKCVGRKECGMCESVCPMQIRILDENFAKISGEGECILCGRCKETCPYDAIEVSAFSRRV